MADPGQPVAHPWAGSVLVTGLSGYIRIPIPGSGNLVLSLRPPTGFKGSTCTLFFMEKDSKYKGLRLDYDFNKSNKLVDYHWNIEGKAARAFFPGITNHLPAGPVGRYLYQGARAFRYLGTTLVVVGLVVDGISIAEASNPLRRSTEVVSAWAMAWVGARAGGSLGARAGAFGGSFVEPGVGTAVGAVIVGILGAAGGAYAGYKLGERTGDVVYDWAADTVFRLLPEIPVPDLDALTPAP